MTLTRSYEPYGSVLTSAASTGVSTAYSFTGEWGDSSGLLHLRARYYASSQGRFLTADSWPGDHNSPITLNKYLYATANPALETDPSGLYSINQIERIVSKFEPYIARTSYDGVLGSFSVGGLRNKWGFLEILHRAEDWNILRIYKFDKELCVTENDSQTSISREIFRVLGGTSKYVLSATEGTLFLSASGDLLISEKKGGQWFGSNVLQYVADADYFVTSWRDGSNTFATWADTAYAKIRFIGDEVNWAQVLYHFGVLATDRFPLTRGAKLIIKAGFALNDVYDIVIATWPIIDARREGRDPTSEELSTWTAVVNEKSASFSAALIGQSASEVWEIKAVVEEISKGVRYSP